MTQNETIKAIRQLGLTCSVRDGEFRVNYRGGVERTAYYTDDREDALGTARQMAPPAPPAPTGSQPIYTFNTGRKYTAEGQLIAFMEMADGWVFYDLSRMVDGFYVPSRTWPDTAPESIARRLLAAYDRYEAGANRDSREFARIAIAAVQANAVHPLNTRGE